MTRHDLNNKYFEWMYQLVGNYKRSSYRKLLLYLHSIDFDYSIPMDGNRAEDGMCLRYRFGDEYGYAQSMIATYLDDRPCSVLEMLIALAIRCEEHITDDPDVGDRTAHWFWNMLANLDINYETDSRFDERRVEKNIFRFLNREYEPNGEGGLFTVQYRDQDLRSVEIWYQMCWYLSEIM